MTKQQLRALFVPEEEREFINGVIRFTNSVAKTVEAAAVLGKTRVENIPLLIVDPIHLRVTIQYLKNRFPDSDIGYIMEEGSTLKRVYVDWS
jgi:hypothetical protein